MSSLPSLPTRNVCGIEVPDTPLISKAMDYARSHLSDMAYFHVIRSWLFGFAIASKIPSPASRDIELHSIAAILHDLGWQGKTAPISKDKRFEVDGANAARKFIEKEGTGGNGIFIASSSCGMRSRCTQPHLLLGRKSRRL